VDKKQKKKLKRTAKKKKDKAADRAQQEALNNQMNMFDRLPTACSACQKSFPKTRDAHMTWRVTVRNKEQKVRLFCPECQEEAKKIVENNNEV
jgi:hypothetical protein